MQIKARNGVSVSDHC